MLKISEEMAILAAYGCKHMLTPELAAACLVAWPDDPHYGRHFCQASGCVGSSTLCDCLRQARTLCLNTNHAWRFQ